MTAETAADFEALLQFLKTERAFDFTPYKRPSLMRRVQRRVDALGLGGYGEYLDYLQVHPDEFALLFDTILINVTGFFRDRSTWDAVAEGLPRLLAERRSSEPVRAWVAGCASGEEAYTLAMVLAEAMPAEAWRTGLKVYATDVDDDALATARQATYGRKQLAGVSDDLLERYFEPAGESYAVRKELRHLVIFGRHDLLQDAPISRIDVLSCRNTLMYFNTEAQSRIVRRFHFALNDPGLLVLGRAEMLLGYDDLFLAVDLKRRIFSKLASGRVRDQLRVLTGEREGPGVGALTGERVLRAALDVGPAAQIVVDRGGRLLMANQPARRLFRFGHDSVGRPFSELELSYRPVELRSLIEKASAERAATILEDVPWFLPDGAAAWYDVQVVPLVVAGGGPVGVSVAFVDVTRSRALRDELEQANRELETAYEELQSTNEELETTNEELQSTVEELETTNEELQSTNSQLEAMNEELQSTNGQLKAMNDELRERTAELDQVNVYLESILGSVRGGLVVLDDQLCVVVWNRGVQDLFGFGSEEVRGRRFTELDIGLPVAELAGTLERSLRGNRGRAESVVAAVDRRGRQVRCRVSCSPLRQQGQGTRGVVMFVEELAEA